MEACQAGRRTEGVKWQVAVKPVLICPGEETAVCCSPFVTASHVLAGYVCGRRYWVLATGGTSNSHATVGRAMRIY
eukprot:3990592-Pleurochrysis_carterae.AAC.1